MMGLESFLESTMLIERLAGVLAYSLALLIVCNGICVSKPGSVKKWLVTYAVVLAVMAFFYVPAESADLYRLESFMRNWSSQDVSWLIDSMSSSSTPSYILYFWLIGQLGVDGLLPGLTALFIYLLTFSCYWDFAKRKGVDNENVALGLAMYMAVGTFLLAISGIRTYLAFAVVFRAAYTEWVCGRSSLLNLPWYAIAATMHPAATVAVVLRIGYMAFERGSGRYARIGSAFAFLASILILTLFGADYLDNAFSVGASYLSRQTYTYAWEIVIHVILVIFSVYTLRRLRILNLTDAGVYNLAGFATLLTTVSVVALPFEYSIFLRYSTLMSAFLAPLAMVTLQGSEKEARAAYRDRLLLATVAMLLLACVRGDLSGYKFFKL